MNFVYAIMAHNAPEQLRALIDRLVREMASGDRIVLHLDRSSVLWREQRAQFAAHPSGRVELVENPVHVIWGHHSQVAAQLRMLETARKRPFDYYHFISGVDWPVLTRAQMMRDIANDGGDTIYAHIFGEQQSERMQHWWFDERTLPPGHFPRLIENVTRAQVRLSWAASRWWEKAGFKRSLYAGQPWIKGESWYSLPHDAATVLCEEASALMHSGRLRFTQCCDEHVAPTILTRHFGRRIGPSHRYINWAAGGYHPKVLTREDETAIASSGAWFARKFDIAADPFFMADNAFKTGHEPAA